MKELFKLYDELNHLGEQKNFAICTNYGLFASVGSFSLMYSLVHAGNWVPDLLLIASAIFFVLSALFAIGSFFIGLSEGYFLIHFKCFKLIKKYKKEKQLLQNFFDTKKDEISKYLSKFKNYNFLIEEEKTQLENIIDFLKNGDDVINQIKILKDNIDFFENINKRAILLKDNYQEVDSNLIGLERFF